MYADSLRRVEAVLAAQEAREVAAVVAVRYRGGDAVLLQAHLPAAADDAIAGGLAHHGNKVAQDRLLGRRRPVF